MNPRGACRVLDGFEQNLRIGLETAIDHECAVIPAQRDHIAPGALEQLEISRKIRSRDAWSRLWGTGCIRRRQAPCACRRAGAEERAPR
jgi:hypothetical protein